MEKNELTSIQKYQVKLFDEMESTLKLSGCELTEYGKKCAVNCIAGVISFLQSNGKSLKDINQDLLKISIQNVALTELNYASLPAEIYFDLRGDILTIKPQGAGNEKLVRTYGVDVKSVGQCWLIREGDDFILPSYDGLNCVPPKWTRKSLTGKVVAVCYPITKNDGNIEWLISGRDEVVANLIAQIRQNALYKFTKKGEDGKVIYKYGKPVVDEEARQKFYDSLEDITLDDLLKDETLREYINPTYTSGGSRESMIIRKMKNNALKNYPREYNNSFIKDAVVNMFEEQDTSVVEKPNTEEIVDVDSSAPKDFDVDDNGEVKETAKKEQPVKETKVEEKPVEKPVVEETKTENPATEEKVETKPTEETDENDDFGF